LAGIVRYGSYVPFHRVTRAAMGGGRGERAVASHDEDSVSLAVEAAREALRGGPEIATLVFATTSPPYAEKLDAATVQAALDLPESVRSLELTGSTRLGLGALLLGADIATAGERALVCAGDVVVGAPGGARERESGDGAVAFVMGPDDGLRWASGRNDVGALFLILRNGRVEARWNRAMEPLFKEKR